MWGEKMDKWSDHIDNKFGGCDVPYAPTAEPTTVEEQFQRFVKAFQPVVNAVSAVVEVMIPTIKNLCKTINRLWDAVLHTYPNKRVVYLAFHGKKERTRKKNRARIAKWFEEQKDTGIAKWFEEQKDTDEDAGADLEADNGRE